MPPTLPVYREISQTAGDVERHINEWEPRAASGRDLLPIPSKLTLEKILAFAPTDGKDGYTTSQSFNYETNTDSEGRLTQERGTYSGHGGMHRSEYVREYTWKDTFGYTMPGYGTYTGEIRPEQLTILEDGSVFLRQKNTVAFVKEEPRQDGPGSVMRIQIWDSKFGRSLIAEFVDGAGRLEKSTHDIKDEYGARFEFTTYVYDNDGRLLKEVKVVRPEVPKQTEERTETTEFTYNADRTIDLVTTLEDGSVIRTSKRHYHEDGSFHYAETEENIPGQNVRRRSVLTAESYKPIGRQLSMDWTW